MIRWTLTTGDKRKFRGEEKTLDAARAKVRQLAKGKGGGIASFDDLESGKSLFTQEVIPG